MIPLIVAFDAVILEPVNELVTMFELETLEKLAFDPDSVDAVILDAVKLEAEMLPNDTLSVGYESVMKISTSLPLMKYESTLMNYKLVFLFISRKMIDSNF